MNLTILYRGPLSSCNYGCGYCPFAKRRETLQELAADRAALERFVRWVENRPGDVFAIQFTPYGEALTRNWYQQAVARLSRLPHVTKVAVQTNLSCGLDWLGACDRARVGLWTTYHPGETTHARFLGQCRELDRFQVSYSVGGVGLKEHLPAIAALRRELRPEIYLWINAYKDQPDYYEEEMIARFTGIDPLFPVNLKNHASLGKKCRTGSKVISVDGEGTIRRCYAIREPMGNIYEPGFERVLWERACSRAVCDCHIGYVHLEELRLDEIFGLGLLERVPARFVTSGKRC